MSRVNGCNYIYINLKIMIINQATLYLIYYVDVQYGNIGCVVLRSGMQNSKDFSLKVKCSKGFFYIFWNGTIWANLKKKYFLLNDLPIWKVTIIKIVLIVKKSTQNFLSRQVLKPCHYILQLKRHWSFLSTHLSLG